MRDNARSHPPVADAASLLQQLREQDVRLRADGEHLRVTAGKGVLTPALKNAIGVHKEEILRILASQGGPTNGLPPLRPAPRDGRLPLSAGQERLWFLQEMGPSAAYNLQVGLTIRGTIDVALLQRAVDEVFRRHETLRTTFEAHDGRPFQVVHPPSPYPLETIDLSGADPETRRRQARRVRVEQASEIFRLSESPPIRIALVSLGPDAHELLITQHHIVSDGWSLATLLREVLILYRAYGQGEGSPLPELPIQYADYAVWQREWLNSPMVEAQMDYWRRQLAGLPTLELPMDRPRPPLQTYAGAIQTLDVPSDVARKLEALGREENATIFAVLLAGFAVLLARYSGQTDLAIGTSNGNRSQVDLEPVLGFFVNTQVLRADLSGDPTVRDIVRRLMRVILEGVEHQDVPFERVVAELQQVRDLSRSPLFQVMFIMQNTPLERLGRSGEESRLTEQLGLVLSDEIMKQDGVPVPAIGGDRVVREDQSSKFDLTLTCVSMPEGLKGSLEYNTDLFDHATIARMLNHLEGIFAAVAETPDLPLSRVPLLPREEEDQLTKHWNDTRRDGPTEVPVHQLFSRQARLTPDGIALRTESGSLSYGRLEERSNALAHSLLESGIGPRDLVAILVDRSCDMVVSLLGVLKAGAAYVPLDPAFPTDRLAFMLEDAAADVLITHRSLLDAVPRSAARTLCLDDVDWTARPRGEGLPAVEPDDRAYVMYTSGSTGRPKGVEIPHGALTNLLLSMAETPGFSSEDVLLAVTTLSFDIAGLEIFLPLIVGGTTVLVTREVAWDGTALAEALDTWSATVMQATPATWRLLLDTGWEGKSGLKAICGGERLSQELANELAARTGELWNVYGPTETTIWSTVHRVEAGSGPVSIGRPIDNTLVYVLDDALNPTPIGVPGELYIGGQGVARGYLGRPELTAERFVELPHAPEGAGRFYRTGDRVRWREDGTLEYLGRLDFQVKVRGFRIELGEIEATLSGHPDVHEAVAAVYEKSDGDHRLVAYVIPASNPLPDPNELRNALKEHLPDYMVPSLFQFVESFPLTANGKVDRRSLPDPEPAAGTPADRHVAPRNDVERVLQGIWQTVLDVEQVGVHDNFFDLGGHSLLLARAYSQIVEKLGPGLAMIDLFQYPTISALSERLTSSAPQTSSVSGAHSRAARREAARTSRARARTTGRDS